MAFAELTADLAADLTAAARKTVDGLARGPRQWAAGTFLAATAATELAAGFRLPALERIAKPLIIPALTAHALRDPQRWALADRTLFAAMGGLHALGDVVLLGDGEATDAARLTPGALAFGGGHLAGLALYARRGIGFRPLQSIAAGAVGVAVCGVLAAGEGRALRPSAHHLVQGAYAALLVEFMVRGAATYQPGDPAPGADSAADTRSAAGAQLALGAAAWLASDALIAVRLDRPRGSIAKRLLGVAVMDTYATGQLFTYSGIAALCAHRPSSS
ncbi:lysoplasmalogenase family protein [Dietzia sp.]|uniref:lysoplasmalogenase family protein n=1 Tax=Dietzia sp. TaxID=1871616 RepID=UPI002FD95EE5